ncbi:MAG TPA: tetratricopeptide repeat protein [Stellaceae bacterium]|jgi:tetratricopeptide (TPR) repeat protein
MLLGEMLVVRGLATPSQIEAALAFQQQRGGRIGAILIAAGILTSNQLLELLGQQREIRVTLPFCERMLARWEEELGAAHPSTARARYNLARVLLADGRADEALELSKKALETSRLLYGSSHRWTKQSAEVKEACELALNHRGTQMLARLRALELADGQ